MASVPPDTNRDVVYHRQNARTLQEHVYSWAAGRMMAGVPVRRCVLPFLTGAPKAVECRLCFRIIYAGEEIKCSISHCQEMFHLNCVVKDTSNFAAESFRCSQHAFMVCKQKKSILRCGRCRVVAHSKCASWEVIDLKDDRVICSRHPSDWLLQNKKTGFTKSIKEVFCRLPLPYVNENFNVDSIINDFVAVGGKPAHYMYISQNEYLIKRKHTSVHVDTGCKNCKADSACKEDCECRALLMSCSTNCHCSGLCTNKPFLKNKNIKIVKTKQGGWGVIAREPLKKGDFVIEYVGEVIDDTTYEQRLQDIRKRGEKNFYMCEISKDFTIDATFKGNESRMINHKCQPNCKLERWQVDGETRVGIFASRVIQVGQYLNYDFRTLRRHKDKRLPSSHPLDLICEAISRSPHDASVGGRAQHAASIGEEQNNTDSQQKMLEFGRDGLDCEVEHDVHVESLNVSANDADQQAQTRDEHVTKRPITISTGGILKKHKAIAEMPCIQETWSVDPESRSAEANLNKQEANLNKQGADPGKDYSISRCLDVLEAMDDVPDEMKILASDVFRDATNREMFLCYAPRLRGLWLKKELEKLHGPQRVIK